MLVTGNGIMSYQEKQLQKKHVKPRGVLLLLAVTVECNATLIETSLQCSVHNIDAHKKCKTKFFNSILLEKWAKYFTLFILFDRKRFSHFFLGGEGG